MIQFNLLPDVKLDYIRTQRTKRRVVVISGMLAAVSFGIFLLLFLSVNVVQKQHLSNLNKDIAKESAKLAAVQDVDKILTVQNQMNSLPELHEQKPAVSRLFNYLSQLTPSDISINDVSFDFTSQTIAINGTGKSFSSINKFVDTLKFTKYTVEGQQDGAQAFSEVVLANFSRDDKSATYQINMKFDPLIFDNTKTVSLTVPEIISTRSEIEKPEALFQQTPGGTN